MMESDFLQDEPKIILTYPHKSKLNTIGYLFIVSSLFIVMLLRNYLQSHRTDFSDKTIIAVVLFYLLIHVFLIGYYLFLNGVKLEIYENNVAKYYTYGNRGHSVLHFKFKLDDIEQIKIKKRSFDCLRLTIKIKDPIFCGFREKKLNKSRNVSIIADRKKAEIFMQQLSSDKTYARTNEFL